MLPLLSLHALAAQRGDGLRPEPKALLERHAAPTNRTRRYDRAGRTGVVFSGDTSCCRRSGKGVRGR